MQENTTKVNSIISKAKEKVESAERQFKHESRRIERKSRNSIIDIYNMSEAVAIVAAAKRATDELYTSYEAVVQIVDMQCRPLLQNGLEASAIKEVADFIKRINKESSELSSNVTGSFNGMALGDMRTEHYVASLESKTVEKFWDVQYSMTSEVTQAGEVCNTKEEKQSKSVEEREDRECQQYELDVAAWNTETERIVRIREETLKEKVDAEYRCRLKNIEAERAYSIEQAEAIKRESQEKKEAMEKELTGLGIFELRKKITARQAIKCMIEHISQAEYSIVRAEERYREANQQLASEMEEFKEKVREEIKKAYPLPKEPRKPYAIYQGKTDRTAGHEILKDEIVQCMDVDKEYTIADIQEFPYCADLSLPYIDRAMEELVHESRVGKVVHDRKRYYSLPN